MQTIFKNNINTKNKILNIRVSSPKQNDAKFFSYSKPIPGINKVKII